MGESSGAGGRAKVRLLAAFSARGTLVPCAYSTRGRGVVAN